jgi:HlyD family type I secretion membrane fusion protein
MSNVLSMRPNEARVGDPPPPDLGHPSRVAKVTVAVIVGTLVVLLVWALFAPLNRGVVAQGRVDTEARRTTVRHADGGTISQVFVSEGQRVKAGDVLATLNDRRLVIEMEQLTIRRLQSLIEQTALIADIENQSSITWPQEVLDAFADPASQAAQWVRIQTVAFNGRRNGRIARIAALREQRNRLAAQAQGLEATRSSLARQSRLIDQEATGLRELERQGFAPRNRVLAIERSAADIDGRIGDVTSNIAQTGIAGDQVDAQIAQTEAEGLERNAARITELQTLISDLDQRIAAQQLQIERTRIRTPVDGVVLVSLPGLLGTVVPAGQAIFEVVPNDRLVVRAEVRPTDIERLYVGQKTTVRFSGLPVQTSPRLDATISFVGADARTNEQGGFSFYEIRVNVPATELRKLGDEPIRAGMPVEVFADGGARTAFQYLIEPVVKAYERSFTE